MKATALCRCLNIPHLVFIGIVMFSGLFYASAQTAGNNAVYNSSGSCTSCAASSAFIDASMFLGSSGTNKGVDLCDIIYKILNGTITTGYTAGAVIDARGLGNSALSGSPLTCTKGSPWQEGSSSVSSASNILLPAGTIVTPSTWVLPPNTHVTGEGDSLLAPATSTIIQVANTFTGDIIDLCSVACTGVAIENVVLNGNGSSANGLVNSFAGNLSYVNHVGLYQILGTGLLVSGSASGSGPYTNINFNTGSAIPSTKTVCAQIKDLTGTNGIRELGCITPGPDPPAAVLLDSSNNSIKDVTISGFYDGILIGANATAHNNVLINVIGDTRTQSCFPHCINPINAVHISSTNVVSDLTIVGLSNEGGTGTSTLRDDTTSTNLTPLTGDTVVGLYSLGKKTTSNTFARFTTSPSVPTWATGTASPSGSCAQGSVYSCTGSSSSCGTYAVWGCPVPGGSWQGIM
jgi:hypothetical protein